MAHDRHTKRREQSNFKFQKEDLALLEGKLYSNPKTESNISRRRAQHDYFWTVCQYEPAALHSLRSQVEPMLTNLSDLHLLGPASQKGIIWQLNDLEESEKYTRSQKAEITAILKAILDWSRSTIFGLIDIDNRWVPDLALAVLADYYSSSEAHKEKNAKHEGKAVPAGYFWVALSKDRGWTEPSPMEQVNFVLTSHDEYNDRIFELKEEDERAAYRKSVVLSYEPTLETRAHAYERLLKAFETKLEQYLDQIERKITQDGYEPTKLKRARSYTKQVHYIWLYYSQVHGFSVREIADGMAELSEAVSESAAVSEAAVSKAINELADLIGLNLSACTS